VTLWRIVSKKAHILSESILLDPRGLIMHRSSRSVLSLRQWLVCGAFFSGMALGQATSVVAESPPVLLQMIRDDSVHEELGLSGEQIESVRQSLAKVDPRWFRARNLQPQEKSAEIADLTQVMQTNLDASLDAGQLKRLQQLQCQALGTRMFVLDHVIDRLKLTPAAIASLKEAFDQTDRDAANLQSRINNKALTAAEGNRQLGKLKTSEQTKVTKMLSDSQMQSVGQLTGESFQFSQVKRMYPLATPLETEGVKWIQGGPLKIEDLKGKVVAIHFYAYQCINCQRNLPHYTAWHKDYEKDGLVIIGIQTPETPSERNFESVAQAAVAEGISYPLLLDSDSKNWSAWSNTMWPTVYLIDRQGFIRRWYQGELNWEGNNGEKDFRESIESLLRESD
jgi:peroxiredoxin